MVQLIMDEIKNGIWSVSILVIGKQIGGLLDPYLSHMRKNGVLQ